MKNRLLQIMQHEGFSPSKFAEKIGIKRSAMSHYMSGRNDPGVDVLRKIYEQLPHFNLEWLLTGNGSMIADKNVTIVTPLSPEVKSAQLDMFSTPPPKQPPTSVTEKSNPPVKAIIAAQPPQPSEYRQEIRVQPPRSASRQSVYEQNMQQKKDSKNVTKIMLFYSDDTFETFIPEKGRKDKG